MPSEAAWRGCLVRLRNGPLLVVVLALASRSSGHARVFSTEPGRPHTGCHFFFFFLAYSVPKQEPTAAAGGRSMNPSPAWDVLDQHTTEDAAIALPGEGPRVRSDFSDDF